MWGVVCFPHIIRKGKLMAEPIKIPEEDSKKDTVRINLPPAVPNRAPTPAAKHDTSRINTADEAKKETAMMGGSFPSEASTDKNQTMLMGTPIPSSDAKKETSRVTVPSSKPTVPEMPRPTVRLRRESATGTPTASPTGVLSHTPTVKPPVPEMPRPTVKLKMEEHAPAAPSPTLISPIAPSAAASAAASPSTTADAMFSIAAAVVSLAAMIYLAVVALT
jgi:hypothetical protein